MGASNESEYVIEQPSVRSGVSLVQWLLRIKEKKLFFLLRALLK